MRVDARPGGQVDLTPGHTAIIDVALGSAQTESDGVTVRLHGLIAHAGEAAQRTAVSRAEAAATFERHAEVSATVHMTIERARRCRARAQALRASAARNRERSAHMLARMTAASRD